MICLELFLVFFKIGLFTFGGGYAMIPMINREVTSRGWLTDEMLIDFIAIAESTPGTFAINLATFVGTNVGSVLGALSATLGVVLPSFIIILIVAKLYSKFVKNKTILGFFTGIRPVVTALIAVATVNIISKTLFVNVNISDISTYINIDYIGMIIAVLMTALLIFRKKTSPILIVMLSGVLGLAMYGIESSFG